MRNLVQFVVAIAVGIAPTVALADKNLPEIKSPEKTAPFASWTAAQQWMPQAGNGHDDRTDHGYGNLSGMLLLADELADHFSELGRASLIEKCFANAKEDTSSLMIWTLCGPDVKALDMKKLETELSGEGITAQDKADALADVKETVGKAQKVGAAIEAAAKDDPGVVAFLKLADTAKTEWAAYLAKNKADFDRYLALKDAVRSGKSNNKGFAGCYEATQPAFAKLVKATAPKIPWDVGNDPLPGYMSYLVKTTEGYIASVAWAACAWGADKSGEAPYGAAANRENGGTIRAGWRTIALAKTLDPDLKTKFADRSLNTYSQSFQWKYGVKMAGVNEVAAITTPSDGEIGALKADGDMTKVVFKKDKVEECLQWADTNKVQSVNNGNVQYEKVCKKRGMVDNDEGTVEVPTKYIAGAKVGDKLQIVGGFPVVAWKAKKLTELLGVSLK